MVRTKEIIYPIFLECCKFTTDKFWYNTFEDLSYGISPYGTYFSHDLLCCNFKKKTFSYNIIGKNSETIFYEIYELLREKVGLMSETERRVKQLDTEGIISRLKSARASWGSIKKKNLKDLTIEIFVSEMKVKYSLSIAQSREIMMFIKLGLVFKSISADDIVYLDGKIQSINGIEFSEGDVTIQNSLYGAFSTANINYDFQIKKRYLKDDWEKYIKSLQSLVKI